METDTPETVTPVDDESASSTLLTTIGTHVIVGVLSVVGVDLLRRFKNRQRNNGPILESPTTEDQN